MDLLINKSMMDVVREEVPTQDIEGEVLKVVAVILIK